MNEYLTAKELADRWGWNVGSLANLRHQKRGPKFERIGRAVVYHIASIRTFEMSFAKKSKNPGHFSIGRMHSALKRRKKH